jgi:hypothetical protein
MAQKAPPEYSEGNSGPTWRLDGADKLHSRCALSHNYYLFPNVTDPGSLKPDLNTKPDFLIVPGPGPSNDKKFGI